MSDEARKEGFVPPPHANAEIHKRIMARVRQMSPQEFFEVAVQAGVYTADGELTEPYKSEEPSKYRPRDWLEEREEADPGAEDQVEVKVPKNLVPAVQDLLEKRGV